MDEQQIIDDNRVRTVKTSSWNPYPKLSWPVPVWTGVRLVWVFVLENSKVVRRIPFWHSSKQMHFLKFRSTSKLCKDSLTLNPLHTIFFLWWLKEPITFKFSFAWYRLSTTKIFLFVSYNFVKFCSLSAPYTIYDFNYIWNSDPLMVLYLIYHTAVGGGILTRFFSHNVDVEILFSV